jgi:hypothetical protein
VDPRSANNHIIADFLIIQGIADFLDSKYAFRNKAERKKAVNDYFWALDDAARILSQMDLKSALSNPGNFDDVIDSLDFTIGLHKAAVRHYLAGKFKTVSEQERAVKKARNLIRVVGNKAREIKRMYRSQWTQYHESKYGRYLRYKG